MSEVKSELAAINEKLDAIQSTIATEAEQVSKEVKKLQELAEQNADNSELAEELHAVANRLSDIETNVKGILPDPEVPETEPEAPVAEDSEPETDSETEEN